MAGRPADVVKTTSVMKAGVGFVLPERRSGWPPGPELLTGDTNIVEREPGLAVRRQQSLGIPVSCRRYSETFTETVAEAVLTEAVAAMPIDEVLTTGRVAMQETVKKRTQAVLDRHRSGVQITSVNIMAMSLDRSVAEAFQDVADAMADREKMLNEARAYQNDLIPKARGAARMVLSEAQAYKQQRIAEAVGETTASSRS